MATAIIIILLVSENDFETVKQGISGKQPFVNENLYL